METIQVLPTERLYHPTVVALCAAYLAFSIGRPPVLPFSVVFYRISFAVLSASPTVLLSFCAINSSFLLRHLLFLFASFCQLTPLRSSSTGSATRMVFQTGSSRLCTTSDRPLNPSLYRTEFPTPHTAAPAPLVVLLLPVGLLLLGNPFLATNPLTFTP